MMFKSFGFALRSFDIQYQLITVNANGMPIQSGIWKNINNSAPADDARVHRIPICVSRFSFS